MKKLFMLMLLVLPALVNAQFTFTSNNGAITITGYTGPGGRSVVIPSIIQGLPVKIIGDDAFSPYFGNTSGTSLPTSLTIPDSVTSIGNSVFYECYSLTNISIGSGVGSIGAGTFAYC